MNPDPSLHRQKKSHTKQDRKWGSILRRGSSLLPGRAVGGGVMAALGRHCHLLPAKPRSSKVGGCGHPRGLEGPEPCGVAWARGTPNPWSTGAQQRTLGHASFRGTSVDPQPRGTHPRSSEQRQGQVHAEPAQARDPEPGAGAGLGNMNATRGPWGAVGAVGGRGGPWGALTYSSRIR